MLKFLFVGGLLLALLLGYTNQDPSPSSSGTPASAVSGSTPWSGTSIGGRTFWEYQAKAGTALWKSSLRWCQEEYAHQSQPTIAQGVCTLVLSVNADLQGTTSS